MTAWFANVGPTITRFRSTVGQATVMTPGSSIFARAIAIFIIVLLVAISLVIIVPLLVIAGIFILVIAAVLKARQLIGRALNLFPRNDGRRNVRVRLPAE